MSSVKAIQPNHPSNFQFSDLICTGKNNLRLCFIASTLSIFLASAALAEVKMEAGSHGRGLDKKALEIEQEAATMSGDEVAPSKPEKTNPSSAQPAPLHKKILNEVKKSKADIANLDYPKEFVLKIQGYFARELGVHEPDFDKVFGKDVIFARFGKGDDVQSYYDYALHIAEALNLESFDDKSDKQKVIDRNIVLLKSIHPHDFKKQDLKENYLNQKRAVDEIQIIGKSGHGNLYLVSMNLYALPPHIGALDGLKVLDVSSNQLSSLPIEVANLQNLEVLDLSVNEFTNLPIQIGALAKLEALVLSYNRLSSLPAQIVLLENLTSLELISNDFTKFPLEITQLKNIEEVVMGSNDLESLPAQIGKMETLERLEVPQNNLKSLPAEIEKLTNLKILNVSMNELEVLPASVLKLTELRHLSARENRIKTIEPGLGQMINLEFLDVSDNQLPGLTPEIGELASLQHMSISDNRLMTFPSEIGKLQNLSYLNIQNNGALTYTAALETSFKKLKQKEPPCIIDRD